MGVYMQTRAVRACMCGISRETSACQARQKAPDMRSLKMRLQSCMSQHVRIFIFHWGDLAEVQHILRETVAHGHCESVDTQTCFQIPR